MKAMALLIGAVSLLAGLGFANSFNDDSWRNEDSWPAYIENSPVGLHADDSELLSLQKKQYNICLDELRHRYTYWEMGECQLQDVVEAANRLDENRIDPPTTDEARTDLYLSRLDFAKYLNIRARDSNRPKQEVMNIVDQKVAKAFEVAVEIQIAKLKE